MSNLLSSFLSVFFSLGYEQNKCFCVCISSIVFARIHEKHVSHVSCQLQRILKCTFCPFSRLVLLHFLLLVLHKLQYMLLYTLTAHVISFVSSGQAMALVLILF